MNPNCNFDQVPARKHVSKLSKQTQSFKLGQLGLPNPIVNDLDSNESKFGQLIIHGLDSEDEIWLPLKIRHKPSWFFVSK